MIAVRMNIDLVELRLTMLLVLGISSRLLRITACAACRYILFCHYQYMVVRLQFVILLFLFGF